MEGPRSFKERVRADWNGSRGMSMEAWSCCNATLTLVFKELRSKIFADSSLEGVGVSFLVVCGCLKPLSFFKAHLPCNFDWLVKQAQVYVCHVQSVQYWCICLQREFKLNPYTTLSDLHPNYIMDQVFEQGFTFVFWEVRRSETFQNGWRWRFSLERTTFPLRSVSFECRFWVLILQLQARNNATHLFNIILRSQFAVKKVMAGVSSSHSPPLDQWFMEN